MTQFGTQRIHTLRLAFAVIATTLGLCLAAKPCHAWQEPGDQAAVEAGRDALNGVWDYPWYDASADGVRPLRIKPPPPPSKPWFNNNTQPVGSSGWNFSFGTTLAWIAVAAILAALAYLLIKTFLTRETGAVWSGKSTEAAAPTTDVDRVESLPFPVRRPDANLLDEARRNYAAGNYNEAITYLYSHELIQLDKAQLIRLERSKTNRQYLAEASRQRPVGKILGRTMIAFEDAFFGGHVLQRDRFELCWQELHEFSQLIGGTA